MRHAKQRRQGAQTPSSGVSRRQVVAGLVALLAAVVLLIAFAFKSSNSTQSADNVGTATAVAQFTPVAGLAAGPARCTFSEMVAAGLYHQHAHLTILNQGKEVTVPSQIGFAYNHDCLYWVHTHNPSEGIIHMESPYKITPKLGDFFHIWGAKLTNYEVAGVKLLPGQQIKTYVNLKPYLGDPATIPLHRHTLVTMEIGPPFRAPKSFRWNNL